jgi:hypothetical protein
MEAVRTQLSNPLVAGAIALGLVGVVAAYPPQLLPPAQLQQLLITADIVPAADTALLSAYDRPASATLPPKV